MEPKTCLDVWIRVIKGYASYDSCQLPGRFGDRFSRLVLVTASVLVLFATASAQEGIVRRLKHITALTRFPFTLLARYYKRLTISTPTKATIVANN
jgi:hypothetical protein